MQRLVAAGETRLAAKISLTDKLFLHILLKINNVRDAIV